MPRPPATKRRQQAEKSRSEIYGAAMELFVERGFGATTVKDITERAGVSVGNFYHYYSSKNAVLEENFHRADERFRDLRESGGVAGEGTERIVAYMVEYGRLITENGFDFAKELYTYRTKLFLREGGAMHEGLVAILAQCQAEGLVDPALEARSLGRYIFMVARGLVLDWCLRDGKGDLVAEMEGTMRLLVRGLGVPGAGNAG